MESVEVQRLRQMLKAARPLLRELSIACARVEEDLDRAAQNAQPKEAQHGQQNYRIGHERDWRLEVTTP